MTGSTGYGKNVSGESCHLVGNHGIREAPRIPSLFALCTPVREETRRDPSLSQCRLHILIGRAMDTPPAWLVRYHERVSPPHPLPFFPSKAGGEGSQGFCDGQRGLCRGQARDSGYDASLRFGLGRFNTQEEVDFAIATVDEAVQRLRRMA